MAENGGAGAERGAVNGVTEIDLSAERNLTLRSPALTANCKTRNS